MRKGREGRSELICEHMCLSVRWWVREQLICVGFLFYHEGSRGWTLVFRLHSKQLLPTELSYPRSLFESLPSSIPLQFLRNWLFYVPRLSALPLLLARVRLCCHFYGLMFRMLSCRSCCHMAAFIIAATALYLLPEVGKKRPLERSLLLSPKL